MTIHKAIELLSNLDTTIESTQDRDLWDALQLAIGALQIITEFRKTNNRDMLWHLPSETKE